MLFAPDPVRGFDLPGLAARAARAEAVGLHRVAVSDHLVYHVPTFDPVVCLTAMATATTRVRLATEVMVLPLRHPVQVAQSVASLDVLSGGRIELGVGVGGEWPHEYAAVGIDPRTRGHRADEALAVVKALWEGGPVTFEGRHFRLDGVDLGLRPVQAEDLPIVVGGRSEAALARAARLGDRWDGIFFDSVSYARRVGRLRELADQAGRRVDTGLVVWGCIGPPREQARALLAETLEGFYQLPFERFARSALWGDLDDCRSRLEELTAAGASDVTVIPVGDLDEELEALGALAEHRAHASLR
ncbi:MAG TPA: TIGR03619 family F420-dependent LLM class oxidoreductase [Acidimicrobiales bacterium]|nr:TIGR03619 family F420-dependent LLM class oxidoreductase [Acidimicrobiales bacterium]